MIHFSKTKAWNFGGPMHVGWFQNPNKSSCLLQHFQGIVNWNNSGNSTRCPRDSLRFLSLSAPFPPKAHFPVYAPISSAFPFSFQIPQSSVSGGRQTKEAWPNVSKLKQYSSGYKCWAVLNLIFAHGKSVNAFLPDKRKWTSFVRTTNPLAERNNNAAFSFPR